MISKHTYYKFENYQPFKPSLTEELFQFPNIGLWHLRVPPIILRSIVKFYSPSLKK